MPRKFDLTKRARIVTACAVAAFAAFLAGTEYWARVVVPRSPEFLTAREYVITSPIVRKEFGEVLSVESRRGSRFEWSAAKSQERSGHFYFAVSGKRDTGVVKVYWRCLPGAERFEVRRLTRVEPLERSGDLLRR